MDRNAVYEMLLNNVTWFRASGPFEEGHTFLYAPRNVIARRGHSDVIDSAFACLEEYSAVLGAEDHLPPLLPHERDDPIAVAMDYVRDVGRPFLFYEGYAFNAQAEGRARYEAVAAAARASGFVPLLSNADAADRWNNKRNFRDKVSARYGPHAVPTGKTWEMPDLNALIVFAEERFGAGAAKVIFKMSGAGGFGNLILAPGDDLHRRLTNWIDHPVDPGNTWVTAEEWRPWHLSPCTSFFSDGSHWAVAMELCDQILSPQSAGFIGGKSFIALGEEDKQTLIEFQRPIAQEMFDEGIIGFVGIDTILCEPRPGDTLLLPESGWAVAFIETNVRLNGHNQERLFVRKLAAHQGVDADRIDHLRVGNHPVNGSRSRSESSRFFADMLHEHALPLTQQRMEPGCAYFILDVNYGERRSMYDAVVIVGIDAKDEIEQAYAHLATLGLLKTG